MRFHFDTVETLFDSMFVTLEVKWLGVAFSFYSTSLKFQRNAARHWFRTKARSRSAQRISAFNIFKKKTKKIFCLTPYNPIKFEHGEKKNTWIKRYVHPFLWY